MQATRSKSTPPPIPLSARKPGPMTEPQTRAVRPTITVWIGNASYQAILV